MNSFQNIENLEILVVEDNFINMLLIKTLLTKNGCKVISATNGKEAVDRLSSITPDIILMDINMPIMNGYEASKVIRKSETRISTIPIIAVTAEMHPDTKSKCIESGMNDFIPKPINIDDLMESIKKCLVKL